MKHTCCMKTDMPREAAKQLKKKGKPAWLHIPAETFSRLRPLAEAAKEQGVALYAVGGCVRDWLLGKTAVADLDLVCEGDPGRLARLAAKTLGAEAEAFGRFKTWRVKGKTLRVDFAAARQEEYPEPACLPKVSSADIRLDLFRRDFTINAMAVPLGCEGAGEVLDPYGGQKDLAAGVVRVLHQASFRDDPTRVFRAARFICRFGFKPAPGLVEMARNSLYGCIAGKLSRHRISQELLRILAEAAPEAPLRRLRSWGWLDIVSPDVGVKVSGCSVEERLGSLALAMGERGEEFIRSLPVEHGMSRRILEALRLAAGKTAPRTALDPAAAAIVAAAFPALPKSALQPRYLAGRDLKAAGLRPGPEFKSYLDDAAREQWAGRIVSRAGALKWLQARLRDVK